MPNELHRSCIACSSNPGNGRLESRFLVLENLVLKVWHPLPANTTGQTSLECPVDGCHRNFTARAWTAAVKSILRHAHSVHGITASSRSMCALCGEETGTRPSRHRCLADAPRPESAPTVLSFRCPSCRDEFPSRRALYNHETAHIMAARRAEAEVELPIPDTRQRRRGVERRRRAATTAGVQVQERGALPQGSADEPARREATPGSSALPQGLAEGPTGREASARHGAPPLGPMVEPTRREARASHGAGTPPTVPADVVPTEVGVRASPLGSAEEPTGREAPTGCSTPLQGAVEEPVEREAAAERGDIAPPIESADVVPTRVGALTIGRNECEVPPQGPAEEPTEREALTSRNPREPPLESAVAEPITVETTRPITTRRDGRTTPQPPQSQVSETEEASLLAIEYGVRLREACRSPITNEGWDSFIELISELEAKARDLLKIQRRGPPRDSRSPPPPVDDPKTIQSLYRRNRRRAVRLISGATHVRCELPPREVEAYFREVWRAREWDPSITSRIKATQSPVDLCPFTTEEVEARLARFENTAPGEDGIDYKGWRTVDAGTFALTHVFTGKSQ